MSDDTLPELTSAGKAAAQRQRMYELREQVHDMVRKFDDAKMWDSVQSRDLPAEMADYVNGRLAEGAEFQEIRRELGIRRSTDTAWKKIMAHIRQGVRIDGTAFLVHKAHEMNRISKKLVAQIEDALDNGTTVVLDGKDGKYIEKIFGPTKELSGAIDAYNRLAQGFVKIGKDLGAFVESDGGKGQGGGVTIVIQSNIELPKQKDIEIHQAKEREKNRVILEQNRTPVDAIPKPEA